MKILIVDDEVLVRKGIITCVKWKDIGINTVFEANNGEMALKIIEDQRIDILLTDIKMPKISGLELIERVKIVSPKTISIVLSCVNDMEVVRGALKFGGALDYIPKLSMTAEELEQVLQKAITYIKIEEDKKTRVKPLEKQQLSFLSVHKEEQLRKAIEYETAERIREEIDQILFEVSRLEKQWKDSQDWEVIWAIYITLIRKYRLDKYEIFKENENVRMLIENKRTIREVGDYFTRIAILVQKKIVTEKRIQYDENICKALDYIHLHATRSIKLKEVASAIGVSESYISRQFKKIMNMNFNDYLNHYRIELAKKILDSKKMSIQKIAEEVGYSNSSYFVQIFKEIVGVTPKQYQNDKYINNLHTSKKQTEK